MKLHIRHAEPTDYAAIIAVMNDWWGGRQVRDLLPKVFFVHFRDTSFVVEEKGQPIAFLIGFYSQTFPGLGYIHAIGVHPDHRKRGIAKALYERFYDTVRERGCRLVRAITSPVNKTSIAFHLAMGFQIEPGDAVDDGLPVHRDPPGNTRVHFLKELS